MQSRDFNESRQEMEELLREETIGYLGLSMDDAPYVVPLNYMTIRLTHHTLVAELLYTQAGDGQTARVLGSDG